jgi:hypothetical protein
MVKRLAKKLEPSRIAAMRLLFKAFLSGLAAALLVPPVHAQLDPEKRRLVQIGYNQPLEGSAPMAGYGFFYYNNPEIYRTNMVLRLAVAPVYIDSELGFRGLLGPRTDLGIGLAGGGFADSYFEIRRGVYHRSDSFDGHGGALALRLFHQLTDNRIPSWLVLEAALRQSIFSRRKATHPAFEPPDDLTAFHLRTGLRIGGHEPMLTSPLGMELSIWHQSRFRFDSGPYGFAGDRQVEPSSHLFWGRAMIRYLFDPTEQMMELGVTAGTSLHADRLGAYRLGGLLPFAVEFPLSIPGYFFEELSAKRFALLNAHYSFPLERTKSWRLSTYAATGIMEYVEGLEQPGKWHSGVGGGITYISPSGAWLVTLLYGHGINAMRSHGRGANQVSILFQYDFEARKRPKERWFIPGLNPYGSQAGERLLRN